MLQLSGSITPAGTAGSGGLEFDFMVGGMFGRRSRSTKARF